MQFHNNRSKKLAPILSASKF